METKKVLVKVKDSSIKFPEFNSDQSYFYLRVSTFNRLFKGSEEIPLNRLDYSIQKKGMICLRPFERVVVGTGLTFSFEGVILDIINNDNLLINQGLQVAGHSFNEDSELEIVLYNGSQFLSEIFINSIVAKAAFVTTQSVEFVI